MPNVPYRYEVNWHLITGNGSLIPICSLSNRSLLPSLTVHKKRNIIQIFKYLQVCNCFFCKCPQTLFKKIGYFNYFCLLLVCTVCAIGRAVSAERVTYLEFQIKKGLEKRVCNIHTVSLQVFCSLPFSVIAYGEFQQCVPSTYLRFFSWNCNVHCSSSLSNFFCWHHEIYQ